MKNNSQNTGFTIKILIPLVVLLGLHLIPGIPLFIAPSLAILFIIGVWQLIYRPATELFSPSPINYIESIKKRLPQKIRLIQNKNEVFIELKQMKVGDHIKVLPNEIIPCDGKIISGTTRVDESLLTGVVLSVHHEKGDRVFSGTFNEDAAIIIQIDRPQNQMTLWSLETEWQKAFTKLSGIPSIVKKLSFVVPLLICIPAFVIFTLKPSPLFLRLFIGLSLPLGLIPLFYYRDLAIPALSHLLHSLSPMGLLVKNPRALLSLTKTDAFFFEKTGTVTKGEYLFSQVFFENKVSQETFLSTFFSLENNQEHPLAHGMKTHPWYAEIPKCSVKNLEVHPGLGMTGDIVELGKKDRPAVVGNLRFIKEKKLTISSALREKVEMLEMMGETVVLAGWNKEAYGLISFGDTINPAVKDLLSFLSTKKIEPILISGDHEAMISHLSVTKGFKKIFTRLLPEEKVKKIHQFQDEGRFISYISTGFDEEKLPEVVDSSFIYNASLTSLNSRGDVLLFGQDLLKVSRVLDCILKELGSIEKLGKQDIIILAFLSISGIALGSLATPITVATYLFARWASLFRIEVGK